MEKPFKILWPEDDDPMRGVRWWLDGVEPFQGDYYPPVVIQIIVQETKPSPRRPPCGDIAKRA